MTEEEQIEALRKDVERNLPNMEKTNIFLSLFTPSMRKEPVPLIQMGLAVLMDKPIAVVALKGEPIPQNLRKLAFYVGEAKDPSELEHHVRAAMAAFEKLKEEKR